MFGFITRLVKNILLTAFVLIPISLILAFLVIALICFVASSFGGWGIIGLFVIAYAWWITSMS